MAPSSRGGSRGDADAAALGAGIIIASREARIAQAQRARAERHFASVRHRAVTQALAGLARSNAALAPGR